VTRFMDHAPRPAIVTGAAVLIFLVGGLNALAGLILVTAGGGLVLTLGLLSLAVAAAEIYAGMQVLALRERGRILAIVLAGIGLTFQVVSIGRGGASILGILIHGSIIWILVRNRQSFTR
jgi:hypothetical protein